MANIIRVKRSNVPGRVPTVSDLDLGELAVNTYDGKLFLKQNAGTEEIVEIGSSSFEAISLTNATLASHIYVCANNNPNQEILSIDIGVHRTAKFLIQVKAGTDFMCTEMLCITNGTEVFSTQYATLTTSTIFCTFDTSLSGNTLLLLASPSSSGSVIKIVSQLITT